MGGGPLALAGPIMQLAGGAGGGGKGGGGGGGGGGVSPQEAALARYESQQRMVGYQSQLANTNTGVSTISTQRAGGARLLKAEKLAGISDTNQQVQGEGLQQQAKFAGQQAGQTAAASNQGFSGNQGSLGRSGDASGTTDQVE